MVQEQKLLTVPGALLADIPVPAGFRAGITLIAAGSQVFAPSEFLKSRAASLAQFGVFGTIHGSHQVHSKRVVVVGDSSEAVSAVDADAMITTRPDAVLTYIVGDCLPIFLVDRQTRAIGLVHSGWKGTGIVAEAVRSMTAQFNSQPSDLTATIGPGIGVCCYRVPTQRGTDFAREFGPETVLWETEGVPRIDLKRANVRLLEAAGVEDITVLTDCTFCNFLFGSSRREGSESFTRMLTFIHRVGGDSQTRLWRHS
jgi:YfiH family protein